MANDSRLFYSIRSSNFFFIATVGLGMICDAFLYAFVVPLLPSFLENRSNVPPEEIQSAISKTLAVFATAALIGSPIAGVIADRVPYRSVPFLASLVFLAAGTAMFLTVRSFALLMVARALQGLSTTMTFTVGLAMLFDRVGAARMGATVGSVFAIISVAQLAAPTLGGWLYEKAGIGPLRVITLGFIALDFLMRLAVIEASESEIKTTDAEQPGRSVNPISADPLETPHSQDSEQALLLPQSATNTKPGRYPLPIPLPSYMSAYPIFIILRDPRLLAAQMVQFSQSFQFSAIDATLPPELAFRLGFSSGPISLMILPWVIPFAICDPIFGCLVDRIGAKAPAVAGMVTWAVILLLMRLPIQIIEDGNRHLGIAVWAIMLALNGLAAASVGSGGIVAAGKVADGYMQEHPHIMAGKHGRGPYAQLFSINSIVFNLGLATGPAVSGALRSSIGYANMNAVLAGVVLVASIVCYIYMDGWPVCGRGYEPQLDIEAEEAIE